jgi:hypothetical protein
MILIYWYFTHQGEISLKQFLCSEKALKGESDKCLDESFPSLLSKEGRQKSPKKKKGKKEDKQSKEDTGDKLDVEPDSQESEELVTGKGKEEL